MDERPDDKDPNYRDLWLHCRCSGGRTYAERDLGTWCGRLADQEDGLCRRCRDQCVRLGMNVIVLTVEQVVTRDTPWLERTDELKGAGQ
jgi:hypothetical protein